MIFISVDGLCTAAGIHIVEFDPLMYVVWCDAEPGVFLQIYRAGLVAYGIMDDIVQKFYLQGQIPGDDDVFQGIKKSISANFTIFFFAFCNLRHILMKLFRRYNCAPLMRLSRAYHNESHKAMLKK